MKVMRSYISIGQHVFEQRLSKAVIKTSRKTLTDTCLLELPNFGRMLESSIKVGDPVLVKLGYDNELRVEFVGYVSATLPQVPFKIECEDEMWLLKQKEVKPISWKETTLSAVVKHLVPNAIVKVPDVNLTSYRITGKNTTVARVLSDLKKQFGLDVYFRENTLYCGLAFTEEIGEVVYHFQRNLPFNQDNLRFVTKESVKIKVVAESLQPDNKKIKIEVGDPDGEKRTLHFYNLTKEELRTLAEERIKLLKFDGFRGEFKAKGQPLPKHSMTAHLIDDKRPERTGKYIIDEVVTTYGSNGFNRKIKPGYKV